jgi:hypothetical protein
LLDICAGLGLQTTRGTATVPISESETLTLE